MEQTIREISYDEQLAQGPWQGRLIKLADVYDNLTDSVPKMRTNYIEKANRILVLTQNDKQLQGAREYLLELMHEMAKC